MVELTVEEQLLAKFKVWVGQFAIHHPFWAQGTRDTYIRDAKRILQTNDLLPGGGYRTVWKYIFDLDKAKAAPLDASVRARFC